MPLPAGPWKANVNGNELNLVINPPDTAGTIYGQLAEARLMGFWNEAAQEISFDVLWTDAAAPEAQPVPSGFFSGCLFRPPPTQDPGRDITATLTGRFRVSPTFSGLLYGAKPSARRQDFGWLAQCTETN